MRNKIIVPLVLLLMVGFVIAEVDWEEPSYIFYDQLSVEDFKALSNETLNNFSIELRGIENESQDYVYYFYINTYFLTEDENNIQWVVPVRETRYIGCYEEDYCLGFYNDEIEITKESEFNYLKELQNEL